MVGMDEPKPSTPNLDNVFRDLFSFNRGPGYRISVTDAAPDLSVINVEFRFLAGHSYCCAEPGCHLPRNCERLVRLAAERSIRLPDDLIVCWHCVVEEGASLECRRSPTVTNAYEFDAVVGNTPPRAQPSS